MTKSSSCVVTLGRFAVWRWAVAAVAGAALAALAAWAAASLASSSSEAEMPILITAIGLGIGTLLLALSLARVEAGILASHDGRWTFTPDASPHEAFAGKLAVALDLGSFLLLTVTGSGARRRRWLPVQRRGLAHEWHALRCAVYSPPLAAAETVAANE